MEPLDGARQWFAHASKAGQAAAMEATLNITYDWRFYVALEV